MLSLPREEEAMKVQCDVCGREEASVFCCADEAALCAACDRRVHRANKLASKHRRLSLLPTSDGHAPALCDVCQEKRAFVFCQEDRAILCRDCDVPIHTANHMTMKHNRFLLTGVRLSSDPSPSCPSEEAQLQDSETSHDKTSITQTNQKEAATVDKEVRCTTTAAATATINTTANSINSVVSCGSSISEYLIKMLPGWRVEDLLVDDAAAAASCSSTMDSFFQNDELLPFLEVDLDSGGLGVAAEKFPVWAPHVPQAPPQSYPTTTTAASDATLHYHPGVASKVLNPSQHQLVVKAGRELWSDDTFRVPQISPQSSNNKRPRASTWYF